MDHAIVSSFFHNEFSHPKNCLAKLPAIDNDFQRSDINNKDQLKAALFACCEGNPAMTCGFHSQKISNAESGSLPRCHRAYSQIYHYCDVIMGAMASQITSLTIVYSTVHSGADQRKHQSSASQAFEWGIHQSPVNSPHKWPVTQKMFPFDDGFMYKWDLIKTLSISVRELLMVTRNYTIFPQAATLYLTNTKQCYLCKQHRWR